MKPTVVLKELRDRFSNIVNPDDIEYSTFVDVCPIPMYVVLGKGRTTEVVTWRQTGMAWLYACGHGFNLCGEIFNVEHSTVIHATKKVLEAVEDRRYDPLLHDCFMEVLDAHHSLLKLSPLELEFDLCRVLEYESNCGHPTQKDINKIKGINEREVKHFLSGLSLY